MKGWQQVDQMTGSMRDTIKLIMIDDDRSIGTFAWAGGELIRKLVTTINLFVANQRYTYINPHKKGYG